MNKLISYIQIAVMAALIVILITRIPPATQVQPVQIQKPQTQLQLLNYPLSQEVTTYIGKRDLEESFVAPDLADKLISVVHKVVYDEPSKQFNYTYKLSYVGKVKCFLNWQLLDRINNTELSLLELEPSKTYEFTMSSPKPPVITEGSVWLYKQKGTLWELVRLQSQIGPLPKSEN